MDMFTKWVEHAKVEASIAYLSGHLVHATHFGGGARAVSVAAVALANLADAMQQADAFCEYLSKA